MRDADESFGSAGALPEPMDAEGLVRRAEVLQRIADQLSCQLETERRANDELRTLAGEPPALRAGDDERAATHRFMTFAAVAVVTAAAVAMLVARPWGSTEVYLSGPPDLQLQAPAELGARKSVLVPISVVDWPRAADAALPAWEPAPIGSRHRGPKDFVLWELRDVP